LRPPIRRAAAVQIGTPARQIIAVKAICIQGDGNLWMPHANGNPRSAPHVPGAHGIRPVQSPVAKTTDGAVQGIPA
jgi:hypothetical protein